jgi:acylphosphatase
LSKQRVRAVVTGRVQGVWYRDSCRREAERLGVTGWIRNRSDGNVELEAEGDRDALDALLRWCAVGPRLAVVSNVTVTDDLDATGGIGFHVR